MQENKVDKKKIVARVLVICAAALIVLAAAAGVYLSRQYVRLGQQFIPVSVTTLDLRGSGITDLSALDRCTALTELDVRENDISVEKLDAFRAAHPGCRVLYSVYLNGEAYDSGTEALTLEDLPNDWENIRLFENLRALTVNHCTAPDAMETLRAELPNCEMRYSLCIGALWFDSEAEEITVSGSAATAMEVLSQLAHFPSVRTVNLPDVLFTADEQHSLLSAYPGIRFSWSVQIGSQRVSNTALELSLSGEDAAALSQLTAALDLLPDLRSVDLTACSAPVADRLAFIEQHPDISAGWTVSVEGQEVEWNTELLDLNNYSIADVASLEAAFAELPKLTKVEMCDTNLSYEQLDALNQKYENIRVVWKVYFGNYYLRTDAEYFIAAAWGDNKVYLTDDDIGCWKYCTDLKGLDIGHMNITDLSFLQYMPHMTYLIIAECPISDISPLAQLKELRYLEMFQTKVTDLSPLIECTALKAVNLPYTEVRQANAWAVLPQLTQLELLWYPSAPLTGTQRRQLENALPNTTLFLYNGCEPSGGIWRYNPYYYEMRDFFEMYYMPGGTNGVDENGDQIIIDDWGEEFILEDWDGGPRWWEEPQYSDMHPHIYGITC